MEKKYKYFEIFGLLHKFVQYGLFLLVFFLFSCLTSCKTDTKMDSGEAQSEREVFVPDKSFAPFYDRFHSDSVYQLEHINFPLQGMPQRIDSTSLATRDFFWEKESWVIQHDFDEKATGFTKTINTISPEMIEETILDKSGQFGILRRFVKLDGEWYLIYFSGLGQRQQ